MNLQRALSKFDEILLLDIYPARELPIAGVEFCLKTNNKIKLINIIKII